VKVAATTLGVPIVQPVKMKDGTLAAQLRAHDLDALVVVAFGRILPTEILGLPRHGCINVHGSILPRWRGAAPIQRAVLAGDTETGVTIMAMDEGLDTGAVYTLRRTAIGPLETSGELFERLAQLGAEALESFLTDFPQTPPPRPQNDAEATYAPPLRKDEGRIEWHRSCPDIINHIRGMDPWPTAFTTRGSGVLKLFRAIPSAAPNGVLPLPGTVVRTDSEGLHIACLNGLVCVSEVQPPGKKRMPAMDYVAGKPFSEGERLGFHDET
jgi:methionyl-tRNA formyltransferase